MLGRILIALLALVGLLAVVAVAGYYMLKRPDISYETLASKYETPASRYIDLPGGVHMHYHDEGLQGAPTLLLVHGFSVALDSWDPWVERLDDEFRIIRIDLPGHGLTRAPAGYQASIEALRDVTAEFVSAYGLTSFALAGNSMGGNVAWEYALAHPSQVDALVLVDSSGWPETREEFAKEPPMFALLRNPVAGPLLRDLDNSALMRKGLEAGFVDKSLATDEMIQRYVDFSRAPGHRDITVQLALGFRSRNFATPERLAPLDMPVLILQGDQDVLVAPDHAQKFHDAIEGAEFVLFEGVGHQPQNEIPDQSAMAVREFLYRVHEPPALAEAD